MISELYISDLKVDTTDDVVFALNYWMADIRKPENRNTNFSKTIVIPGTQANNTLFTHIYQIGVDSTFNPNLKAQVILLSAGAKTFEGYCQLKNIIRQYSGAISYEINLFGELGNIFSDMGELYLSDLDFSEYNHSKTAAAITGSWANTSGFVYPLINNGEVDTQTVINPVFDTLTMKAALFAKTIWDKIFTTYGFSYASTFISGSPFNKLIVPQVGTAKLRVTSMTGSVNFNIIPTLPGTVTTCEINIVKVLPNGVTSVIYYNYNTIIDSGTCSVAINLANVNLEQYALIHIEAKIASTDPVTFASHLGSSTWVVTYSDVSGFAYPGGDISVTNAAGLISTSYTTVIFGTETSDVFGKYNSATGVHTVPQISLAEDIPVMKQRDFVISLIRMFNLYIDVDKDNSKNLIILPRDTYYAGGTVVSWETKEDLSKNYTQQPMPFLDFKRHEWNYKADTDFYNELYRDTWGEDYGNAYIDVTTDFQTQTSKIELSFSATPSVQAALSNLVLPTIIKENPVDAITGNTFVGNPRILYYAGLKPTSTDWILQEGSTQTSYPTYPFASHVDDPLLPTVDILFGTPKQVYWFMVAANYTNNNLYNVYYSKFIEEITDKDSKLLTIYLYLTPHDIQKLNFQNAYYLLNNSFVINKIIDFAPDKPGVTKVELLKTKLGTAHISGRATKPPKPGKPQSNYVWWEPQDSAMVILNGRHWKYGQSIDEVWAPTGTVDPISIFSPKDSAF